MSLTPQIKRYVARQLGSGDGTAPSAWIVSGSDIAYTQGSVGIGVAPPSYLLDVGGDLNIAGVYRIGGTQVLSATALGSGVTTSSLTTVGTIGTGVWQGTAIANAYIATGLDVAKLTVGTTLPSNVVTSSLTAVGTIATGVWQGTAISDTYLATISTAGKVSNSATTATSANTANAIVARDASGNFSAGTITASLSGNATTATTADKVAHALTAGTYLTAGGTFDGSVARTFAVDATDANTASKVVARDAAGAFSAGAISATALTSTGLVTFASLKGTGSTTVTNILDEDNMASNSDTALATQQSIKAYVDAQVTASDSLSEVLAIGNTTGANDIIVSSGQKIRTPAIAAGDGTASIIIANSTGALTLSSALADSNLATISTAGKVSNSATTATASNTNSAIVARDGSGNFSAGTITASLSGNASTATTADKVANALTAGTYLTSGGTFDGAAARTFAVDATSANTASKVVARDASGNFSAGTITATFSGNLTGNVTGNVSGSSGSTTGNAATATALSSARTFALTGDITGSVSSDLTSGASIATAIAAGVIVNADISASAAIADTKLDTIATAGKVSNSATTATASNTPSTIVLRDGSGNFSAGTVTATFAGNLTGNVTGDVSGNAGTVTNGVYTTGTYSNPTWITALAGSKISGNISGNATNVTGTVAIANGGTGATTYASYSGLGLESGDDILLEASTVGNEESLWLETSDDPKVLIYKPTTNSFDVIPAGVSGQYLQYANENVAWADGNVANALTAGTYLTSGGTFDGSVARTFAVDATDANTASKVVARDASGNFSAGTITATFSGNLTGNVTGNVSGSSGSTTGNAATATKLATSRNINGVAFDGTADITVTAAAGTLTGNTLASGINASSLTSVGTLTGLTVARGSSGLVASFGISGATNNPKVEITPDESNNQIYIDSPGCFFRTASTSRLEIGDTGTYIYNNAYLQASVYSTGIYTTTVGATNRDVFVDNAGLVGYVASIRAAKSNITSLNEVSWLLSLRPVEFNYRKKDATGTYGEDVEDEVSYGLIAEEVEAINPRLCFYDTVDGLPELRGVSYSKLIVPMLRHIQALESRLSAIEEAQ